jgi:hypothetical protein
VEEFPMIETKTLSRRMVVAGTAALAAGPVLAAAPAAPTPIASLWAQAQTLATRLASHRGLIAEAAARAGDGVPGWMRLGGEANAIAEERYGKLVAILRETPKNAGDLAIIAKVSQDADISAGARLWASERLAAATLAIAA